MDTVRLTCAAIVAPCRRAVQAAGGLLRVGRGAYGRLVVAGRWIIVAGWLAAVVAATVLLPNGERVSDSNIGGLIPSGSPVVQVERRALRLFQVPVLSETSVVVYNPRGLSALTRADAVLWAAAHDRSPLKAGRSLPPGRIAGVVPIPAGIPTVAVSYLYVSPYTSQAATVALAQKYARHFHNQAPVRTFVTGIVPAQVSQTRLLLGRLGVFGAASVVLVGLIIGVAFRSVLAPLAVLAVAGAAYLLTIRVLGALAAVGFVALPGEVEPLIVAILLGVVTDYSVLMLASLRDLPPGAADRLAAARQVAGRDGPIVTVAGLAVMSGTAALLSAHFQLFRSFGPALTGTVLIGLIASLTLVPAAIAIAGHRIFWPGRPAGPRKGSRLMDGLLRLMRTRARSGIAAALCLGLLLLAGLPLLWMRLNLSFTQGLPPADPVRRGAQVLAAAGVRGITAPTELLVREPGITSHRAALDRLQTELAHQPGIAMVLGPKQNPLRNDYGVVLSRDHTTARYVLIYDSDPLAGTASTRLRALMRRAPHLLASAGLPGARPQFTGETAIALEVEQLIRTNLTRVILIAFGLELLLLGIYLRAIVTPLVLLACSAATVAAALGLTTLVFQTILGQPGLGFYEPFATAVLLVAFGSDYNVFVVGSIWQARESSLAGALRRALPGSSAAISTAGLTLAASFALVAIIPLATFHQIAFTMGTGLLIDTFMVRPVLTPSLLTVLGPASSWPSRRFAPQPAAPATARPPATG
jgi:RND superfamily putative drug exporter